MDRWTGAHIMPHNYRHGGIKMGIRLLGKSIKHAFKPRKMLLNNSDNRYIILKALLQNNTNAQ